MTLEFESLRPNGAFFKPLVPLVGSRSILPVFMNVSTPLVWLLRRDEELDFIILLEEFEFRRLPPFFNGGKVSGAVNGLGAAS